MRSWLVAPLFALLCSIIAVASDYHYTVRYTWNGQPSEVTYWISGGKIRNEHRSSYDAGRTVRYGSRLASIMDCASQQAIDLNLDDREYATHDKGTGGADEVKSQSKPNRTAVRKLAIKFEPSITVESNTVDTGERQIFFGHQARHFITTTKFIAHNQPVPLEQLTDGWYFDFYPTTTCGPWAGYWKGNFLTALNAHWLDVRRSADYEFKYSGPKLPGMPVKQTVRYHRSFRMPDGSLQDVSDLIEVEIVDFSEKPLDAALFRVPSGFKKVQRISYAPPTSFSDIVQDWWERLKYDLSQALH